MNIESETVIAHLKAERDKYKLALEQIMDKGESYASWKIANKALEDK